MNKSEQEEIAEIIKKNLPAQVGDVLKLRLAQADALEKEVESLKARNAECVKITADQKKQIDEYAGKDSLYIQTVNMCAKLEDDTRKLDIERLSYQLQSEKDKTAFAQGVAMGLVRNIEYRRVLQDMKSGPDGRDQYGNQTYSTHTQNSTETTKPE